MISAIIPYCGAGNSLPLVFYGYHESGVAPYARFLANLNSIPLDYVLRQKIQGQNLNLFLIEQLPIILPKTYERRFGRKTAADIVKEEVLALTYTALDMEPFARDMGHVDPKTGDVLPPFKWDEEDRAHRRAKLDALYFHLYGITDRDDVKYIFSTFPIVEREDTARWRRYLSRDLCLAYMDALEAGDPDIRVCLR